MRNSRPRVLKPFTAGPDRVGHGEQFVEAIGDHMATDHAPETVLRRVNINRHATSQSKYSQS